LHYNSIPTLLKEISMIEQVELQELVRERQVGQIEPEAFLARATAVLENPAHAAALLAAAAPRAGHTPPPVRTGTTAAAPGLSLEKGLQTGYVSYSGATGEDFLAYWAAAPDGDERGAVIVLQEWWGVNEHIKDVTRRFAAAGYLALAPDLYHGVVTTEPDEARKEAMAMGMRDAVGEIRAAVEYVRGQEMSNGRVGLVGFCMGGGLVLNTAVVDHTISAAGVFYGRPLAPDDAAVVAAPVISFLGSEDGIPAAGYESMHAAFTATGIRNEFHLYPGAGHAFFNDTRAAYDAAAAADAWQRLQTWFATYLS
jgi:carboxymethylenebutenolidase